jgi:hypothetical protein
MHIIYGFRKIHDFLLRKAMKTYGHWTLKYARVEYVFFTAHHNDVLVCATHHNDVLMCTFAIASVNAWIDGVHDYFAPEKRKLRGEPTTS